MNVAILTRDLLDRSRIDAAVRAAGGRVTDLEIANVVFVDLRTVPPREITAYAEMATVVAYGPHVEGDVLAAASAAGAEETATTVPSWLRAPLSTDPAMVIGGPI